MPNDLGRETGLLRDLVEHLELRPRPSGRITREFLRREGLGHVRRKDDVIVCIRAPAHRALADLADCLISRLPDMERGAVYSNIETELLNFLEGYVGCERSAIGSQDSRNLVDHFKQWFADRASLRHVFIPCMISRVPAPRFEIGPVTFEHIDHIAESDFYPLGASTDQAHQLGFGRLLKWMRDGGSYWLARVAVHDCEQERSQALAELTVDLAIVALQLAAPDFHTRTMARLDVRRGPSEKCTWSVSDGQYDFGWTSREPGMPIGPGTLPEILRTASRGLSAVGNVVRSFASGSFRLPILERAWCDAAYWFNQALAESIDTIAIVKLETALEVLLGEEANSGSGARILKILGAFFDLEPNDPISASSLLTAKKLSQNIAENRSRILHGTWSTLKPRSINRVGMEDFVNNVLRISVIELDAYARSVNAPDDIDEFLNWVRLRKERL